MRKAYLATCALRFTEIPILIEFRITSRNLFKQGTFYLLTMNNSLHFLLNLRQVANTKYYRLWATFY